MAKIGIIICDRERTRIGGKCFMAVHERAPAEMKKYGAEEVVLASCFFTGYPPCPYLKDFMTYIEKVVGVPVVVGSHPMPTNYITAHMRAGDWTQEHKEYLKLLVDDQSASDRYDSSLPGFLK